MEPGLIDAAEVARLLGVSRRMVYDLVSSGRLRCYRFSSRAVRFDVADVEALRRASLVEAPRVPACRPPTVRLEVNEPRSPLLEYFAAHGVKPRTRPPGAK